MNFTNEKVHSNRYQEKLQYHQTIYTLSANGKHVSNERKHFRLVKNSLHEALIGILYKPNTKFNERSALSWSLKCNLFLIPEVETRETMLNQRYRNDK